MSMLKTLPYLATVITQQECLTFSIKGIMSDATTIALAPDVLSLATMSLSVNNVVPGQDMMPMY